MERNTQNSVNCWFFHLPITFAFIPTHHSREAPGNAGWWGLGSRASVTRSGWLAPSRKIYQLSRTRWDMSGEVFSWVWPPPSNSGIFRLSDLLQLELLWAHPVKRDEPTNAQLMYKMMMTNEPNKLNNPKDTNRQNNHPHASTIELGYDRHRPLRLLRVPRLVWKAFQRACWVLTAS